MWALFDKPRKRFGNKYVFSCKLINEYPVTHAARCLFIREYCVVKIKLFSYVIFSKIGIPSWMQQGGHEYYDGPHVFTEYTAVINGIVCHATSNQL